MGRGARQERLHPAAEAGAAAAAHEPHAERAVLQWVVGVRTAVSVAAVLLKLESWTDDRAADTGGCDIVQRCHHHATQMALPHAQYPP